MTAILRRELGAYFRSPIGYIYLFVFFVLSGFYFTFGTLFQNTTELSATFSSMMTFVLFLVPILTMRLLSEDKKNKTDQALLTAPVTLTGLVVGKFLAAMTVYLLGMLITLVYGLVVAIWSPPNWAGIFANFLALTLFGAALVAIGMFISSLTENQVIAATGGFAVGIGLLLLDSMAGVTNNELLSKVVTSLSFYTRYSDFAFGIFNFSSILYFASVCFLFLFFTVRVLEKRRWS